MKILTYGDGPKTSTGYGQIWDNLLSRWAKLKPDWKFMHCGWQTHDREHETKDGYFMLPINKVEYGFDTVVPYLMQHKPDILLTMADVGITAGFIDQVNAARLKGWRGKWIAISLFDTETWEYMLWNRILDIPDINLAGAKNGELQMLKHNVKNIRYIPFGVDTKLYYPLAEREKLRLRFSLNNKFIIGFVGKNQRRKMQPYLLRGFARFAKGKNDVRLLLHTDVESGAGWTIPTLISKFENEIDPELDKPIAKIIFTNQNLDVLARQKITPESMNEIYNLMDVFCYAVGGEGFGLPGIECQSAGIPLMMTNYSSAIEIVSEEDLLIPVLKDKYDRNVTEIGNNGVENAIPDDNEITKLLEKMYLEWKEGKLKTRSEKARKFALKYDWDFIAPRYIKLFEEEA
ncbi:MAG: glycosyltransferase [Chloroflexi bacterium]|nr:glycosyltransferase [Chloroflexota bacterium]